MKQNKFPKIFLEPLWYIRFFCYSYIVGNILMIIPIIMNSGTQSIGKQAIAVLITQSIVAALIVLATKLLKWSKGIKIKGRRANRLLLQLDKVERKQMNGYQSEAYDQLASEYREAGYISYGAYLSYKKVI